MRYGTLQAFGAVLLLHGWVRALFACPWSLNLGVPPDSSRRVEALRLADFNMVPGVVVAWGLAALGFECFGV